MIDYKKLMKPSTDAMLFWSWLLVTFVLFRENMISQQVAMVMGLPALGFFMRAQDSETKISKPEAEKIAQVEMSRLQGSGVIPAGTLMLDGESMLNVPLCDRYMIGFSLSSLGRVRHYVAVVTIFGRFAGQGEMLGKFSALKEHEKGAIQVEKREERAAPTQKEQQQVQQVKETEGGV